MEIRKYEQHYVNMLDKLKINFFKDTNFQNGMKNK